MKLFHFFYYAISSYLFLFICVIVLITSLIDLVANFNSDPIILKQYEKFFYSLNLRITDGH